MEGRGGEEEQQHMQEQEEEKVEEHCVDFMVISIWGVK